MQMRTEANKDLGRMDFIFHVIRTLWGMPPNEMPAECLELRRYRKTKTLLTMDNPNRMYTPGSCLLNSALPYLNRPEPIPPIILSTIS